MFRKGMQKFRGQTLTTPSNDKAGIGVADPGVPAPHQGVRDAVRPQLFSKGNSIQENTEN
jgi:hypothetical protein